MGLRSHISKTWRSIEKSSLRQLQIRALLCCLVVISSVSADDRPQWGQRYSRNMVSSETGLPDSFDPADGKNIKQLTSLGKISASAAWSPDMKWISFRVTDHAYWRSETEKEKAYSEKKPDQRPVWVMGADGSNPHVIEVLHYQCAIDGSCAAWKPK